MREIISNKFRQRGATLIEVLVTMVVLAIGLLGYSALQTASLKASRDGLYRSLATFYASSTIDCMRAGRGDGSNLAAVGAACVTAVKAGAQADGKELENNLPGGDLKIAGPDGAGNWTMTVSWRESNAEDDEDDSKTQFTTGFRP